MLYTAHVVRNTLQIQNSSVKLVTQPQSPQCSHAIANAVRNTLQPQNNVVKMTAHKKYQSSIRDVVIYTALG